MKVFNGYLLIMKRKMGLVLLYFGIFVGITFMIQSSTPKTDSKSFLKSSVKITVIDQDGNELAKGLTDYLGKNNELVTFDDDKDVLRDALYYRKTSFIIYIPADFENKCLNGNEEIGITSVPGSYTESLISYQIDSFLNQVQTFKSCGYNTSDAITKTIALQEIHPDVSIQDGSNSEIPGYTYAFRYMPYLFLATLCCAIGMLLVIFREENVKERIACAPVSSARRTLEMIMALGIISLCLWVVSLVITLLECKGTILSDPNMIYYIANSFFLLLTCLSIAVITGTLVKKASIITNVATTVSLGLSFLCGAFVPLGMMGAGVKKVVQVLPVYWFENSNDLLGNYQVLTGSMKNTIYLGFIIQSVFAFACICIAMFINKLQDEK